MICQFEITKEQLQKALAAIEKAEARGFKASTALLQLTATRTGADHITATFAGAVILKAHPVLARFNWGQCKVPQIHWYRCIGGRLLED